VEVLEMPRIARCLVTLVIVCILPGACKASPSTVTGPALAVDRPGVTGAVGVSTGSVNTTIPVEAKGLTLDNITRGVGVLTNRVDRIEKQVVEIQTTTAAIAERTQSIMTGVQALHASTATGMFSGSGIYAVLALALVLAFQLVGVVLWWRVGRSVKANGVRVAKPDRCPLLGKCPVHPNEYPREGLTAPTP
jgi:hypothetical protein